MKIKKQYTPPTIEAIIDTSPPLLLTNSHGEEEIKVDPDETINNEDDVW